MEAPKAPTIREPGRSERARNSGYHFRFSIVYALLAAVAAGSIAALVVVVTRPDAAKAQNWSKFEPTGSSIARTRQIATKVSGEYKLEADHKLAAVVPSPLQTTRFLQGDSGPVSVEVPISTLAVQPDVSTGKHEEGDFKLYNAATTVAYQMCGFGTTAQNCAISGPATTARGQLLRREALELALYTLKYVPGTNAVLTYLPPRADQAAPPTSVLVARSDVKEILDEPLSHTITPKSSIVLGDKSADFAEVDKLTLPHLFTYDYQTLPGDGTAILVLTAAIKAA
jgi:hypothetical protein